MPFVVWGPGVDAGTDLYALNPQLADPGTSQPAYSAEAGPVRNAFVADVTTQLLRLDRVAGSTLPAQPLTLSSATDE